VAPSPHDFRPRHGRPSARLILLQKALEALTVGSLDQANVITGVSMPALFLGGTKTWRIRLDDIHKNFAAAPWLVPAVYGTPAEAVVGYAGFHNPPNAARRVGIAYTIVPEYRRQGYGREAAIKLRRFAAAAPEVQTIRASITLDNAASQAPVRSLGFPHVGEQWDDEDKLEWLFERDLGKQPVRSKECFRQLIVASVAR
jgi:[ribosomal protein S5]-alanine N-acetyltransferase